MVIYIKPWLAHWPFMAKIAAIFFMNLIVSLCTVVSFSSSNVLAIYFAGVLSALWILFMLLDLRIYWHVLKTEGGGAAAESPTNPPLNG